MGKIKHSVTVARDGPELQFNRAKLESGVVHDVQSDAPVFLTTNENFGWFSFVADSSRTYFVPAVCNVRQTCKDSVIRHMSFFLGTPVGSLFNEQVVAQWDNVLKENIKDHVLLVKDDGTVLEYGVDWRLSLDVVDSNGHHGDAVDMIFLEAGAAYTFIWGLLPAGVTGQGTKSLTLDMPPVNAPQTVWAHSVDLKSKAAIEIVPFAPVEEIITREKTHSHWLLEQYPEFVQFLEVWLGRAGLENASARYLRQLDDGLDPNMADGEERALLYDQYVPSLPQSPVLLKNSHDVWSAKGTPEFAAAVARINGAEIDGIHYPKEDIFRASAAKVHVEEFIYLMQLDRIDVLGYGDRLDRYPKDPAQFAAFQPDVLGQTGTITVTGATSRATGELVFDGWVDSTSPIRVAKYRLTGKRGIFHPWERVLVNEPGYDTAYPYVVPVADHAKVVYPGTGHVVGDKFLATDGNVFGGDGVIVQVTDTGQVIEAALLSPAVFVVDPATRVIKSTTGEPAVIEYLVASTTSRRQNLDGASALSTGARFEGLDEWHPFSYVMTTKTPPELWLNGYVDVAHPSGFQLLVTRRPDARLSAVEHTVDAVYDNADDFFLAAKRYWPKTHKVISDGKVVDPVGVYRDADGNEYITGAAGQMVTTEAADKPARGWAVHHRIVLPNGFGLMHPLRDTKAIAHDRGMWSVNPAGSLGKAESGLVHTSNGGQAFNDAPFEPAKWLTGGATKTNVAKTPEIGWDGIALDGTVALPVVERNDATSVYVKFLFRWAGNNSFKENIKLMFGGAVVDMAWTLDANSQTLVPSSNTTDTSIAGATHVWTRKVPGSSIWETVLRFDWAAAIDEDHPAKIAAGLEGKCEVWYGAVTDELEYWYETGQPADTFAPVDLEVNKNHSFSVIMENPVEGADVLIFKHPQYTLNMKVVQVMGQPHIAVVQNGVTQATKELAAINRLDVAVDRQQGISVYLNERKVWTFLNAYTPKTAEFGAGVDVLHFGALVNVPEGKCNKDMERFVWNS